jgi:hypothetical protein
VLRTAVVAQWDFSLTEPIGVTFLAELLAAIMPQNIRHHFIRTTHPINP